MPALNREVGSMTYDKLIAGLTPEVKVTTGVIRMLAVAATFPRGTVLAKSSGTAGDGKLVILGTEAAADETLTADCILKDDTEVGTAVDAVTPVYDMGCFNESALKVADSYTMTEADKDVLRERGIYLGEVLS